MSPPANTLRAAPVDHYENFPVASWLCPPALRPAVAAIYAFARTADDLADEGPGTATQRLHDLAAFRAELLACGEGRPATGRWPQVFGPLAQAMARHGLPLPLFLDLLDAFEQDVVRTRDAQGYADRAELLDYCRRSANPVGRLMLRLYDVDDAESLARSDRICSALQLINFWQDLSVDIPRGRYYLPADDCLAHGLDPARPQDWARHPQALALVASEVAWARGLMVAGAPLVHRVPGRAGWELRGVVQGGLRILDKIEAQGFDTFSRRPRLRPWDAAPILWRMARMEQFRA
ncbi:squalene synthase HpnC [Ramlibacter rhizophilus]|uniref:Squalene synthase HpnC n=1 Tax=Ramlibacter rhizophilus TaxID=1781167 RepID=A0A4Z0BDR1_9BURK|nr:squalene synthase HpnC [Ramlibacter rhizophilus]TFY96821.1 squalene synthase HpnC [Ramlibacter rhizophilus]